MAHPKNQGPAQPSPKLQALLKDFQQIASMSGYLNHSFDPPQLRLFFTLYGRVMVASPEQGLALTPQLQAWCDAVSNRLREGSSGTIMQPQVQVSAPQAMPDGRDYLVATLTFNTKVTETSYLRIRTAILAAYQDALKMREAGFSVAVEPGTLVAESGSEGSIDGEIDEGQASSQSSDRKEIGTPSPTGEPEMNGPHLIDQAGDGR